MGKIYRDYSHDELEGLYNQRERISDYDDYPVRWLDQSNSARTALEMIPDIIYGPDPLESYDFFPASPGSPIQIFFHGGYWYSQDKINFEFMAPLFVENGISFVGVNYPLCPQSTMGNLLNSCRKMLVHLSQNIKDYVAEPGAFHLAGHSAGGHIAVFLASTDWKQNGYEISPPIKSTLSISGIFDLQPVVYLERNKEIGLNQNDVDQFSPVNIISSFTGKLLLAVGSNEGIEFLRQTQDFAKLMNLKGNECQDIVLQGANHFSILDHYSNADGELFHLVKKMVYE